MKNVFLVSIFILMCCVGTFFKFHKNHENIVIGCDEFGYMNLAKAFSNNKVFDEHVSRPYLKDLLDTLRSKNYSEQEIDWMLVPHAYYIEPHGQKVYNQYGPGTSYVLSFFPLEFMKVFFAPIAIFLLLIISTLATFYVKKNLWGLSNLVVYVFVLLITLTSVFHTELTRVNSLAFTFGLLLGAGILLKKNSLLSCFLIAISANFRIANLLLLLPLIAIINLSISFTYQTFLEWVKAGLLYFSTALLAIVPHLIYVYKLKANPFSPTYSSIDTNSTFDIISNIRFYFDIKSEWFLFHLLAILGLLFLLWKNKITIKSFLAILSFALANYLFFFTHKMQINYYPYASFLIIGGYLLSFIDYEISKAKIQYAIMVISSFVLCDGIIKYQGQKHQTFNQAKEKYKELCNYDIVWGDLIPSAADYVCENSAFKYSVSTEKCRKTTIEYLYNHGYSQIFLINDIPLNKDEILGELSSLNLPIEKINTCSSGLAFIILGK